MACVDGAVSRDARQAERVTADDNPILIPRFAGPTPLSRAVLDPEATGSTGRPARKAQPRC